MQRFVVGSSANARRRLVQAERAARRQATAEARRRSVALDEGRPHPALRAARRQPRQRRLGRPAVRRRRAALLAPVPRRAPRAVRRGCDETGPGQRWVEGVMIRGIWAALRLLLGRGLSSDEPLLPYSSAPPDRLVRDAKRALINDSDDDAVAALDQALSMDPENASALEARKRAFDSSKR